MNEIFSNKPHRSYFLRERADNRYNVLEKKFKRSLNEHAEDDNRILQDYERQLENEAKNLQDRKNT